MKKLIYVLLFAVFAPFTAYASGDINVVVNGQRVEFAGQRPIIIDGNTLVPARGVFERMGFVVDWLDSGEITLLNDLHTVNIQVGSDVFRTNGVIHSFPVTPQIIDGSTMLPFRALIESVNAQAEWDAPSRTIKITTPATETSPLRNGGWMEIERDTSGLAVRATRFDENGIISWDEYENENGLRVRTTTFNADGTIESIMRHEYDSLRRPVRMIFYYPNGTLSHWQVIEYVGYGRGLISRIATYNADGTERR